MEEEYYDDGYDEQAAAEEAEYQAMCDAGAEEEARQEAEAAAAEADQLAESMKAAYENPDPGLLEALENGKVNKEQFEFKLKKE